MALQMNFLSTTGYEFEDVYFKVDEFYCIHGDTVNAKIRGYVSKEHADNGYSFIEGSEELFNFKADFKDDAKNTKMQIYEFVKGSDKFKNSIDV